MTKKFTHEYERIVEGWELSAKEIGEIAKKAGMDKKEIPKFVAFMQDRFPNEASPGYIDEWAGRWINKTVMVYGDSSSQKAAKKAGYKE